MFENQLRKRADTIREGKHKINLRYIDTERLIECRFYLIFGTRKNRKLNEVDYFIATIIYKKNINWSDIDTIQDIFYFDDCHNAFLNFLNLNMRLERADY